MEGILDLEKLFNSLEEKKALNEEEERTRELLNLASTNLDWRHSNDFSFLDKFTSRDFYNALFTLKNEDDAIIEDMIHFEFSMENLKSTPIYVEDDEEIY